MKSKPKSKTRSSRNKRPERSKTQILAKELIIKSACRDEVIWKLYNECRKTKKGGKISIYLQNVNFPVSVHYQTDCLDDLKRKKIIRDYRLGTEERNLPPVILKETIEPNLDILPLISFRDLEEAPKRYHTIDYSEIDYVAIIEYDQKTVLKRLEKDFETVNQKRKEIMKREEIESFFNKEQVLKCNGLRFGLESGNAIYGETLTNFNPGANEYKLLEALMKKLNKRLDYNEINSILNPNALKSPRYISFIVRNIRQKLEIVGPNKKNKDLFHACNGYMMVCK